MKFQILLSTMNGRILNVDINENYNYLIVHQITDGNEDAYQEYINSLETLNDIEYIQSFDVGLSKSRNLALDSSRAEHVWIMDDDTKIFDDCYDNISQYIGLYDFLSIDFLSSAYDVKNTKSCNLNIINSAGVCSIKMILSRKIVDSKIRFNENFGLGSQYPSGEEYIFISEIIKRGFKGYQLDFPGCIHPDETSGQDFFSSDILLKTKFMMFDKVFGSYGMIFSMLFLLKKSLLLFRHKRFLNSINVFKSNYFK